MKSKERGRKRASAPKRGGQVKARNLGGAKRGKPVAVRLFQRAWQKAMRHHGKGERRGKRTKKWSSPEKMVKKGGGERASNGNKKKQGT